MADAPAGEREQLRDYAAELIRQETEAAPERRTTKAQGESWGGLLLLLFVVGLFFLVILPPVGMFTLLAVSMVTVILALKGLLRLAFTTFRSAGGEEDP